MSDFVKLKDLTEFTVIAVDGFRYKMWDTAEKRMVSQDSYFSGSRKLYQVETDHGKLDLGSGQLGSLLEAVFSHGKSDLIGRTFIVKTNGKTGMDVRYFFNPQEGSTGYNQLHDHSTQEQPNPAAPSVPISNYTPDQEPEADNEFPF